MRKVDLVRDLGQKHLFSYQYFDMMVLKYPLTEIGGELAMRIS